MSKLACRGEGAWLKAETQTGLSGDLIGGGGGGGEANRHHIILSRKQTLASASASIRLKLTADSVPQPVGGEEEGGGRGGGVGGGSRSDSRKQMVGGRDQRGRGRRA